jgi:Xaa-Pro aminopeptidase
MSNTKNRLALLRKEMRQLDVDAYIIPVTDPHLGEYVPGHWKVIEWLTGFTGSAANVVVTDSFAGLWTDSRYFIQAERELKDSGFELVKLKIPHTPEYIDWIEKEMTGGNTVAVNGRIIPTGTVKLISRIFSHKGINLNTNLDLLSGIMDNRPAMPSSEAFEHDIRFAGVGRLDKIALIRNKMLEMRADYHLLSSLDDIAWTLNIRGSDVSYSPLFTSFGLIGQGSFQLFADSKKIPDELRIKLRDDNIIIRPYNDISLAIKEVNSGESIIITPATTSASLYNSIKEGVNIIEEVSVPTRLKAVKNKVEIGHITNVMTKDGLALTKFFYWLENALGHEKITEISVADKLLELRMEEENCIGPSFACIAAYNEHGASPHYCSTPETDVELGRDGIFLLDSGGQYLDGTTDVTRTVCLGTPTEKQKTDFTLALKGTISLAMAKFPYGTRGYQIEILARKALWDKGLNYGHGTGHGVGFFLNVHEGPQTIGTGASGDLLTILEPGMLTADEPAIYREGEYGFRTENLILCVDDIETDFGRFLKFETLTLCYIDTLLIIKELLSEEELDWLNDYHRKVFQILGKALPDNISDWLKEKTRPL